MASASAEMPSAASMTARALREGWLWRKRQGQRGQNCERNFK
jgi:hypothetical protein